MVYCDTSLLVAAITREARSDAVRLWLSTLEPGVLCTSAWALTEFASAISLKVRSGQIPADMKPEVLDSWQSMQADQLTVLPVPGEAYALAARLCARHESGLRSGDGLHLAVAMLGGYALATLDGVLADAAKVAGVRVSQV